MNRAGKQQPDDRTEAMKAMEHQTPFSGGKLFPTARIATWSARNRWWVIAASVLAIVSGVVTASVLQPVLQEGDGGLVGESGEGIELLDARFDGGGAPTEQLVFSNSSLTVDHPAYQTTVQELAQDLRALPEVASVVTYYENGDSDLVSADGHVLLAQVVMASDRNDSINPVLDTVSAAEEAAGAGGFTISLVGNMSITKQVTDMVEEDFGRIMLISLGLGLVIILLAFRAVVAALVPLAMAIGSIMIANGIAAVVSQSYALNESYTEMILLLGLAVGIDYSLFIVSRFRSERQAGRPKLEAITVATNTTGRAVAYAGITVVLSLAGLGLTNNPIFISLALGAIFVVLVTIVAAQTFLPALLFALGDNINRLRIPILGRSNGNGGLWSAITKKVLARPALFAASTATLLIVLAAPVTSLNLGFPSGSRAFHDAVPAKNDLQLLEAHFSASVADPALVVVDAPDVTAPGVQAAVASLMEQVTQNGAYIGPFETVVNPEGDLLFIRVPLQGELEVAEAGIETLRKEIVPQAFAGSGARALVTGTAAISMDFRDAMYESAPYVFGFVLGLAFLLLLVMFRSIVIPVKAILLNLLSVSAAYGVLVAVFQWGWGVEMLGSEYSGVILSWLPLFLFAILFGLSMDYHMLLLNRIKEAHDQGQSNSEAVAMGTRVTAGQITSAAAIMVGVFGAFALGRDVGLQQFGVGLGVAVFIDATVIRSVLLPATMKLLGDWNWYLPEWLQWLPQASPDEGASMEAQPVITFGEDPAVSGPVPAS